MNIEERLTGLYKQYTGEEVMTAALLTGAGSNRSYYRLQGPGRFLVGAYNADLKENAAFIGFSSHFAAMGLPVPKMHAVSDDRQCYLLDDLGDTTLFAYLSSIRRDDDPFPKAAVEQYEQIIRWLPRFQFEGDRGLDYGLCYPRAAFDRQSMMWDLNYFKYYFLKLAQIPFDEQLLEDDFHALTSLILEADASFFMYRDFQSRNIMIKDGKPFFIDYQGGRKGPLQYDIASLLYDAKAVIPEKWREHLLNVYLTALSGYRTVDPATFRSHYNAIVLIRIFQALGAYGFRGYYENKPHFLQSIPFAMKNLQVFLDDRRIPSGMPMLESVVRAMTARTDLAGLPKNTGSLVVKVGSFSYRNAPPADDSGNGGGFVFDCRALPNPGRYDDYRSLTGLDQPVIDFLRKEPAVDAFLNHVSALADQSVATYLERGFTSLMISFGCTGGQHRSVYCAAYLATHLQEKFGTRVECRHHELEAKANR